MEEGINGSQEPTKVRRLRIQQRIKSAELGILKEAQENELPNFPSFIPFLPPLSSANLKLYYATCSSLIAGIILFGGILAPSRKENITPIGSKISKHTKVEDANLKGPRRPPKQN
ncbi:protein ORANGE-GREEN, chloroplastic-like isoform X2 [Carya illinoinensis]|uniref:protein ORANGE-GREEN, chloroplastic-like isoform X2 n=1 Tax=Carya illinoinensis TaxID=32201 RepID=UPI001C71F045|nr:protein ORANGE-GREEN, chloroplastic-like isoform X2 [Carya illinoinensis]